MTPKLHARIQRFQRARELAAHRDWAAIATDCGYFDQAHLHHYFVAVLPNHVP